METQRKWHLTTFVIRAGEVTRWFQIPPDSPLRFTQLLGTEPVEVRDIALKRHPRARHRCACLSLCREKRNLLPFPAQFPVVPNNVLRFRPPEETHFDKKPSPWFGDSFGSPMADDQPTNFDARSKYTTDLLLGTRQAVGRD